MFFISQMYDIQTEGRDDLWVKKGGYISAIIP